MTSSRASDHPPIPTIPGLPLLGNALDMGGDMRVYLTRLYQEHGPVFKLTALGQPMIVLAGLEANRFAAKEGTTLFRNREVWTGLDRMFGVERSILSEDGESHRRFRSAQRRAFGKGYLEDNLSDVYGVVQDEVSRLQVGDTIAVTRWCQGLVMEQLAQLCVQSSARPFLLDMVEFLRTSLMVALGMWPKPMMFSPKFMQARHNVFALADALIAHHRRNPPAGQRRADLIDDLLEAQRQDPDNWTEEDVRAGTLTAFSAGLDTAASMLGFTLYRLHKHPQVLAQVKAEVDALFQHGQPTLEALGRSQALHGAVLETLRLHPVAPALQRYAPQAFEFGGYQIPAGSTVMIGSTVLHSLPEVYAQPEEFDPERFGPQRAEHRKAGVFTPFGIGAHTCLGSGMAQGLLLVNVASIVHGLKLHLDPAYTLKVNQQPAPAPAASFKMRVVEVG